MIRKRRSSNIPVESLRNSPNQLNSGYDDIKLSEAVTVGVGDTGTVGRIIFPPTCKYYHYQSKHCDTSTVTSIILQ